jgi:subtilase family serine protease
VPHLARLRRIDDGARGPAHPGAVRKPLYRLARERVEAKWLTGQRPQFTTSNGLHALAPRDFNIIYKVTINNNFNPVSIGVVGRSDIIPEDIANFQSVFETGGQTPQIIVNGPDPGDVPGDDIEGTLDVSWSAAIAVGAQVFFVNSAITNTTDGVFLSELYIIENNLTNVMTYSFGGCEAEFGGEASYDAALAEQAAAQGITFVAASGDAGAEGCDDPNSETVATGPISVNLPASTPFTTAVGGTPPSGPLTSPCSARQLFRSVASS